MSAMGFQAIGNVVRTTDLLWGPLPFTDWFPSKRTSYVELWCSCFVRLNKLLNKQLICRWNVMTIAWRHCGNVCKARILSPVTPQHTASPLRQLPWRVTITPGVVFTSWLDAPPNYHNYAELLRGVWPGSNHELQDTREVPFVVYFHRPVRYIWWQL